ncbi:MAG: hypothetical protein ACLR7K_09875 [Subdoligranulum sp.]
MPQYVQLKDGYTLDDVRDKINACLPERLHASGGDFHRYRNARSSTSRPAVAGLSKEIIAKRNQQKEKSQAQQLC